MNKKHNVLCEFHEELTPSLVIDEVKMTFRCFSCGAAGRVILAGGSILTDEPQGTPGGPMEIFLVREDDQPK